MRFTIWGEVGAEGFNGPVVLSGRLRLLLAGLLVSRNAEVSRNDLITIVWGEESEPTNAEASLRQYVSRLRRALADAEQDADGLITTTPSGYRVDVDRSCIDADLLTDAVAAGVQPADLEAMRSGQPYGAYCDEWWCLAEVERQRQLAIDALELPSVSATGRPTGTVTFLFTDMEGSTQQWEMHQDKMARALARHDEIIRSAIEGHDGYVFSTSGDGFGAAFHRAGDAADAAVEAQRELQTEHWPSPVTVKVRMSLHTGEARERGGDYFGPAANRAVRLMASAHGGQILASSTSSALVEHYELRPLGEHWLKDLSAPDRISQVIGDGLEDEFDPIRSLDIIPNNLPTIDETLIGREGDHANVTALLAEHRLITVVGVGGTGKTRLVLDVAAAQIDSFPDGVWWCELAAVSEADAVTNAIARVLGVRQRPAASMAQSIAEYCRHRRLLLIFDNCEHVLDATASLVELITATGSPAVVLATSREALGCVNEQAYPLPSLALDGDHPPAVELFLRRAHALLPNEDWTEEELTGIDRICRRLDGMPLAIELAAGRVRSLSIAELDQRLNQAFQVLRGGRRRIERHRTLQAAIDWSYQTLDPQHAICFDRLAVFAGGWTLEAAESVIADGTSIRETDVLDILDDLVTKSLVTVDHTHTPDTRYRLLEPLRQYAEDQLANRGEADQTHTAHTAYYTTWAETWEDDSWNDELAWRIAIETELPNLRQAVQWAMAQIDVDRALRIVSALGRSITPFMFYEFGDWGAKATDLPGASEHQLGPLVAGRSVGPFWWRHDLPTARQLTERAEAMSTYEPTSFFPNALRAMLNQFIDGDIDGASEVLARIEPRSPEERLTRAWVRTGYSPDGPHVESDLQVLREIVQQTNSTLASIQYNQARTWAAVARDDRIGAARYARQAISDAKHLGAKFYIHMSLSSLGLSAGTTDGLTQAEIELVAKSLVEQRDAGQETDQWLVLHTAAVVLWQNDRRQLAAQIYQALGGTVWANGVLYKRLSELMAGIDIYLDDTEPPQPLSNLVDRVLDEIPQILEAHDLEKSGHPEPEDRLS